MWVESDRWRIRLFLPETVPVPESEIAVEAIAQRLQHGEADPDHATVPMPGGWGSIFDSSQLSLRYLYGVSPPVRAYLVLGFVGWRNLAALSEDNVYARWFIRGSAGWLDDYPIVVDKMSLGTRLPANGRWLWMLAALRVLARDRSGADLGAAHVFYGAAVDRCRSSTFVVGGRAVRVPGHGPADQHVGADEWQAASAALLDPATRNRLLGRLVLHVLHARLHANPPLGNGLSRPFYQQLRRWFERVCSSSAAACPPACLSGGPGHAVTAEQIWPVLQGLKLLGGHAPLRIELGGDVALPDVFDAYAGEPLPPMACLLPLIAPEARPAFRSAYLLGELLVHLLIDLVQVQTEPGAFMFSQPAYGTMARRMDTTRRQWNKINPDSPMPATEERTTVRELFGELGRSDQRTARRVTELLAALPPAALAGGQACAACLGAWGRTALGRQERQTR